MSAILTEIINILTGGISAIATGIGSGLKALVTNLFLEVSDSGAITGLSTFGGVAMVFCGVSLAIGLCYFVLNWVTSLGK